MEKIIKTDFGRINRLFFNENTVKYGSSLKSVYNGKIFLKTQQIGFTWDIYLGT